MAASSGGCCRCGSCSAFCADTHVHAYRNGQRLYSLDGNYLKEAAPRRRIY